MNQDFMYYPFFVKTPDGLSPNIALPKDYKNLVQKFEEQNRMIIVEDFAREVNEFVSNQSLIKTDSRLIRLKWEVGLLRHIGIGIHGGLDLEERDNRVTYLTHNLGGLNGLYGAMVAINYVFELIKIKR